MENMELHGKKLSDKVREDAEDFVISEQEIARQPVSGEYKKTEDDYRIISVLNDYIQEELKAIEIDEIKAIDPNQIHLFPSITYNQKFPQVDASAFHESFDKIINVDADEAGDIGKLQFFRDLLHEMVHIASKNKYFLKASKGIGVSRSGYRNVNPEKEHEHFQGLNEAIVEKIVIDILQSHRNDIVRDFDVSLEDYNKEGKYFCYYQEYIEIIQSIVKKIAETKGETEDEVWKRFKRGIFTGEMMHLRDIEKIYGKGSLRMLDILESEEMHSAPEKTIHRVKEYFSSK